MNETQHTLNTDGSEPTSFLRIISNKQFRLLWLIGGFASPKTEPLEAKMKFFTLFILHASR